MNNEQMLALKNALLAFPENSIGIRESEPMARHTTFRIGGNADLFLTPKSIDAAVRLLMLLSDMGLPYRVIGNASNLLIADEGYRGVIVCTNELCDVTVSGCSISAMCGATLARCARVAAESSLSGLEKLSGIPGTLGGALAMNAGAYEKDIASLVSSVLVYDVREGTCRTVSASDLAFGYRHSLISDQTLIALQCELMLSERARCDIFAEMNMLAEKRRATQPLELPSAGSVFKRPPNDYAGRLIEAAGLKGARIGGAEVSAKHAGFIVNVGGASARDVQALIEHIKDEVRKKSVVLLVCEIEYVHNGEV